MARLPYLDPKDAVPSARAAYESLPDPVNIFRILLHMGESYVPMLQLGSKILTAQKLSPILRELVILHVARTSRSDYEWVHHKAHALRDGVTSAQVAALESGQISGACFDDTETVVLALADQVMTDVKPSDDMLAEARKMISDQEVTEVTLTVGFYMLMARLMETTGVDMDEPPGQELIDALSLD
jgi:alkylhydroperoxidase family enzyme